MRAQAVLAGAPSGWVCTFSDSGAGGSLVMLKPDLLQGHQILGEFAPPFEDRGVRPLKAQTPDVLSSFSGFRYVRTDVLMITDNKRRR